MFRWDRKTRMELKRVEDEGCERVYKQFRLPEVELSKSYHRHGSERFLLTKHTLNMTYRYINVEDNRKELKEPTWPTEEPTEGRACVRKRKGTQAYAETSKTPIGRRRKEKNRLPCRPGREGLYTVGRMLEWKFLARLACREIVCSSDRHRRYTS